MKKLLRNFFILFSLFYFTFQFLLINKALGIQEQNRNQGVSQQNQIRTNNPETGTMNQDRIQTQTQDRDNLQLQQRIQESKPSYNSNNSENQNRINQVSNTVENMIRLAERIKNQKEADRIRNIAQAQIKSTEKIAQIIDEAQKRSSVTKFFLGTDYKKLKEVKNEIEQNRLRIQELNRIMENIQNEGDRTELQNQINNLELQNTKLQNQLDDLTSGFSLFGWFFRWIYRY